MSKTVDGKTTEHVWDGNKQIIADVKTGQYYDADCYLRGTNLVATYSFENGAKTDYTYYTQNAHGDVVNLTDADGEVVKSYTYDAFGVEKNINDADTNAFRYCGEYYDSETGTIYLRARYYNPSTGRFISRDSYAGENGNPLSLNLYTYCYNNPVIYADATGNCPLIVIGGIALTLTDAALIAGAIVATYALIYSISPTGQQTISNAADAVGDVVGDVGETVGEWRNSASNWWSKNSDAIKATIAAGATSVIKSAVESSVASDNQKKDTKYYIYVLTDDQGIVQYVGQTTCLERRKKQHQKSLSRGDLNFIPVDGMEFDTRWEARNTLNKSDS